MGISSPIGLDENDTRPTSQGVRRRAARSWADTVLRLLQWLLLITGATLLVVHTAAQVDSVQGHEQALDAFDASWDQGRMLRRTQALDSGYGEARPSAAAGVHPPQPPAPR